MKEIVSFLHLQADNIQDTSSRCPDPVTVSELAHIISELRSKANELDEA